MFLVLLALAAGPTDEELVRRFKRGDQGAFDEFVIRYQDRVYTTCLRQLGVPQRAEEIAQDTFIKMYRGLPRFRGESKLSTWVHRIVINTCKNERLRLKRRKNSLHEPLEGKQGLKQDQPLRQIPNPGLGTDHGMHRSEAEKMLSEALAQLEEDHATIITLRDIQGLSYEEIAQILGLPRGTVKSRLHRARLALADLLRNRGLNRDDIFD